jgi:hypothetical protein
MAPVIALNDLDINNWLEFWPFFYNQYGTVSGRFIFFQALDKGHDPEIL